MATVTVTISGPLLSTLIYEHCNSPGDQEGFLLGEICSHITDTISDAQLHAEKEETNLKICAIISCDLFEFYDKKCHLVADKLSALLRDKQKDVVGWYRFRRNASLQTSLREQVLHQRLVRRLGQGYGNYFLLALFRGCTSSNEATHSMEHVFLRSTDPAFKHYSAVPLRIVNLGEPGHSDYRMYPGSAASIHQGAFCEVLNSLSADGSFVMVDHVHRLHNLLHTKLREVLNSVSESEEDAAAFADDILQLRENMDR
uniref:MPN domain-containing protein n=1 Tax=Amblyomma maculatum TaxID=34609 RepID=G3MRW1_AMBMU